MSFLYGLYLTVASVMPSRRRQICAAWASLPAITPSATQPCSMQCSNAAIAAAAVPSSSLANSVTT